MGERKVKLRAFAFLYLGTVGLSVGVTSAGAPAGLLWTETVGMILGRLEFFVVFMGITRMVVNLGAMAGSTGRGD